MSIPEILEEKERCILCVGNPLKVDFTLDEINVLGDINQLRLLKIMLDFPDNFEKSADLFECTRRVLNGETGYRILEFCMLKNRVLVEPISKVFKGLVR